MKNKAKYYYELADVLFYKRIGKNVWVTCKKEAWLKKSPHSAKTWIETMEQYPSRHNPKPISLAKLKEKGINP